jgi:hypothetical protein
MPATNLYMNWSGVSISYGVGPTVVNLTGILNVELDASSRQEMFYGDNRKHSRLIVNTEKNRSVTISGGDVYRLMQIPDDTVVTVTATLNDAQNLTGTGAITFTLVNAVRQQVAPTGPNNRFAVAGVTYVAFGNSSDVDPLSFTQAA